MVAIPVNDQIEYCVYFRKITTTFPILFTEVRPAKQIYLCSMLTDVSKAVTVIVGSGYISYSVARRRPMAPHARLYRSQCAFLASSHMFTVCRNNFRSI